jgi:DNA-binding CsgD family transcriptional regulator/tetratricopeptide (TPR) repeat protein
VRRANSENSRETRYELLAVLRQYAAEHLEATGETAATASRHATYYLALLAGLAADLRGRGQQAALKQISGEIDDVRAAWRWAVTQQDHRAMARAADSLFHFYYMRSWFAEGAAVFEMAAQALAMHRTDNDVALVWGKVLARQGWFVFHLGRQREARTLLEQSLAVLRSLDARAEMVFALNYLAAVCSFLGEYQSTRTLAEESLKLTEASDDQYGRVVACNILGQMSYDLGEYAAAQAWCQQSLAIEQQIGNRWSMAFSLMTLGKVTYALHAYRDARQLFEQSLRIREELGDIRGAALCFNWLGDTAVAMHEHAEAGQRYRQSLEWFQEIGNQWGIAASLLNLGQLAIKQAQYAAATRMLGQGLRLALQIQALPQVLTILSAFVDLLHHTGEPAWAAEWERMVASRLVTLAAVQPPAERLLAWSERVAADLTLEQAIAAIEHQAPILDADRRTMGEQSEAQNPKSKIQYTAGLTAREVEVLRLVAQGLTDKEVAEQLIVSPRTVTTHLTAIYGKLQINSRSAATRFAVDHDLV